MRDQKIEKKVMHHLWGLHLSVHLSVLFLKLVCSPTRTMIKQATLTFIMGFILALLVTHPKPYKFYPTKPPTHLSTIPVTGVSHNPEIKKQVLADYMQLPHITQIAKTVLKGGQIASENWHTDMVELFFFIDGEGVLQLDRDNHTVTAGSVAVVYPPTKHTIFNIGQQDLVLFTVASVP